MGSVAAVKDLPTLQQYLKDTGRYAGAVDSMWGRLTEGAILLALTDGPDTKLVNADFSDAATRLGVTPAKVKAFMQVEAAGAGFQDGRPKILPEPHRFSRATNHRFDEDYPDVSYRKWGARPYARTQDARYATLLKMIRLDTMAGFASASYGGPQIMGENFAMCGYPNSFAFAEAMARDERTQLLAFCGFIEKAGIVPFLKSGNWGQVASRYNGSAYKENKYDTKLAAAASWFDAHPNEIRMG